MKVVLLGTAGYHPNEQRQTACFMLPEVGVVLDAGTGMYRVRDRLATDELDIFLTHAHLDHTFGLTFLLDVLVERPMRRVSVHADREKLEAIQRHLLSRLLFPVALPCDYRALVAPVPLARGGTLTYFPVEHPGGTLGFRLDWPGHSLAYVTDTTARRDSPYLEHIRGVDLLLHECNFPDEQSEFALTTGHSSVTPVAELARAAGVKRLVLIHIWSLPNVDDPVGLDTARGIFSNTELGRDLDEYEF
ncbi:MAG TPA: MBL fold metallo-hydrolase [Pirellulales bacterium]|jgi:ribonuclease BN (tRNA processing enzyme)|nr:MBL fold metallo-hydrolase [Pirellulales bacterium]